MTKYNKKDDYSEISWEFPDSLKQDSPKSEEKEKMSVEDLGEQLVTLAIICPVCKKSFIYWKHPRKYCSDDCAKQMVKKVSKGAIPRFKIFVRDGFRCHYCGRSPHKDPTVILIVDHIIPLSKGGVSIEKNLITCCQQCNSEKVDRLLDPKVTEFLKR